MAINGTSGDDNLTGTSGNDIFNMGQGGNDTISALAGDDTFNFGATFTSADHIDGGDGNDALTLNGDYSNMVLFEAATLRNVEKIVVGAGHNYSMDLLDANVAAGQTLAVNASALAAGNTLFFQDNAETDANLAITAGAGDDTIMTGKFHTIVNAGAGNDNIVVYGGYATVNGQDGDDLIEVTGLVAASCHFDGGTGSNQVFLEGDFSAGQIMGAFWATNIADFGFASGNNYKIQLQDGIVAAGHTLPFYANSLAAANTLSMNASHLTQGNVYLQGGHGNDTLIGGAGNDGFEGREGADRLTGGAGSDNFYYNNVGESTGSGFDRITDLDASNDHIRFSSTTVANIDTAVSGGAVTFGNVDAGLAANVGASQLHAGDAVLYSPATGFLAGHTLLIVDANGVAGYQAGADYVIDVTGMTGTLTTATF